jgi:hypothetical protein
MFGVVRRRRAVGRGEFGSGLVGAGGLRILQLNITDRKTSEHLAMSLPVA